MDANYKFIYAGVVCNDRISDGEVLRNSTLSKAISTNLLNIPGPRTLDDGETEAPYIIVADDAFPSNGKSYETLSFQRTIQETTDL